MGRMQTQSFPGFKHVWLIGLKGDDFGKQITSGFVQYRGRTHKWLIHNYPASEQTIKDILSGKRKCDIVVGYAHGNHVIEWLSRLNLPVLDLIGLSKPSWRTHGIDYFKVGQMAAEHFLEKNHRNLAFCCHGVGPAQKATFDGFAGTARGHVESLSLMDRITMKTHYLLPKEQTLRHEEYFFWFKEMPRPFALLTQSDTLAATVAELAFFADVSVPEELALLGIGDNEEVCQLALPHLSSIVLPGTLLGFRIAEHVDAIFNGMPVPEQELLAPIRVTTRRSTEISAVDDPIIAKALSIMQREAAHRMPIKDIIGQLPVSKRSFNDRFLKAVGRSPRDELFRIRLEIAKERLLQSDQTVVHVAIDCGFADTESMVRHFKEKTGLTPTQFRQQNRLS